MKHANFMAAAMGFVVAGTLAVSAQSAEMANVKIVDDTDRKSTRLNSSHRCISYAVFCLKKKKTKQNKKKQPTTRVRTITRK